MVLALAVGVRSAEIFPMGALPGVSIGGSLPDSYETSGIVWHLRLQKFFLVSDEGRVSYMSVSGTGLTHWKLDKDIEAVTVARPQSNFIYLGIEDPDSVCEFNITTGKVTRTFKLTDWMDGPDSAGLEALTFVPDPDDPEGGLFYAGLQDTGDIFVFRLPIVSSTTSTAVTWIRTIGAVDGVDNISDLCYVPSQDVIYAIYDSDDLLQAMEHDGTLIGQWELPGENQEGITIKGNELYIGQDYGGDGGDVIRYSPFVTGISQPDLDADGKVTLSDFALFAACWKNDGPGMAADMDGDNIVDITDIAILAEFWLAGI
jgi:hypothetical protein